MYCPGTDIRSTRSMIIEVEIKVLRDNKYQNKERSRRLEIVIKNL